MALNSSRTAFNTSSKALRQCRCSSLPPLARLASTAGPAARPFSTSSTLRSEAADAELERGERPRWSYTPEGMKGPGFSINVVKDPRRKIWTVNEDPKLLDAMYNRFLGREGDRLLPDEIKWLAVTHKSFDQGRRGFNTKLAYFGTRRTLSHSPGPYMVSMNWLLTLCFPPFARPTNPCPRGDAIDINIECCWVDGHGRPPRP